jgi:3,4-dihydroxy 2-butanone 4-phosphate synthase / GTP cyclohydrolase II
MSLASHAGPPREVARVLLPTSAGEFEARAFQCASGSVHLALVKGELGDGAGVLTRVHSECVTGDALGSLRCDCGVQLRTALRMIAAAGRGVLIYSTGHEGRGIGLLNKLRAYELQENGFDTVEANLELGFPADARDYGIGNQILADLGLSTIRILTNNPKKLVGIDGFGLTVTEQVPIEVSPNAENRQYLSVKRDKLGHRLHHQDLKDLRIEPESE